MTGSKMEIHTTPISPALEEAYKFQKEVMIGIFTLIIFDLILLTILIW